MKHIIHTLLLALLTCFAINCTSLDSKATIDNAIVKNATGGTVREVKILQKPTNTVGFTNMILPGKALKIGFRAQTMRADYSIVSRTDANGHAFKQSITLPRPNNKDSGTQQVVFTLGPRGALSVLLVGSE